jgi:hypothetical protein
MRFLARTITAALITVVVQKVIRKNTDGGKA